MLALLSDGSSGDDAMSVAGVLLALLHRATRPTSAIATNSSLSRDGRSFLEVWLLQVFAGSLQVFVLLAESFHLTIGCLGFRATVTRIYGGGHQA